MSTTTTQSFYIGVDLGGTNVRAAVIDDNGGVLAFTQVQLQVQRTPESVISDMIDCINGSNKKVGITLENIVAIGIGAPGFLDFAHGLHVFPLDFAHELFPSNITYRSHCRIRKFWAVEKCTHRGDAFTSNR